MKKGIAIILCCALVLALAGCAVPTGQKTETVYEASFLTLFDTVTVLKGAAESQETFEETAGIVQADLTQRLAVAQMLHDGEKYQAIEEKTGASTATISRVNKCLNYGSGGYRTVLDRADTKI